MSGVAAVVQKPQLSVWKLSEEYRDVIVRIDMAVHSKLLALITSSGLQETALLLRPQPTQFFFKYANLCTCTFLLPFECFYMFQYFPNTLVHMAGKARVSRVEKKKEKLTNQYRILFILSSTWSLKTVLRHAHSGLCRSVSLFTF